MVLRTGHLVVLVAVTVLAVGGAYLAGRQSALQSCQEYEFQIGSAMRANEWSVDIKTLTAIREGQTDVVPELEKWIVYRLTDVDLAKLPEGSVGRGVLVETVTSINAYRARFPDSAIDPSKEPRLTAILAVGKR